MDVTAGNCTTNCSNHSSNSKGDEDDEHFFGFRAETDFAPIVLALLIIVANGSVLLLMKRKRSLRTVTNYFLASLASSDILTGLYTIPTYLGCKATERNDICIANLPILTFTSLSTLSHIALVTADRYIAIMFSLRYSAMVTKARATLVIIMIWLVAMVVALIQLTWVVPGVVDVQEDGSEDFTKNEVAYTMAILVTVLVPFPLIVYAYVRIFVQVRRQNRFILNNVVAGAERPRTHEARTVAVFSLMLASYLFCWMPNALIRYQYSTSSFELPEWAEIVIINLRFLTSLLNPCFYVFGKHDFRTSVDCCTRSKNGVNVTTESSSPRTLQTAEGCELQPAGHGNEGRDISL